MSLTQPTSARSACLAPVESLAALAGRLKDADRLEPEDVRALRRLVYANDVVSREEAATLLDIEGLPDGGTPLTVQARRPPGPFAGEDPEAAPAPWPGERTLTFE